MKPPLMLNMIVRNESARIERCLASVLPYIKAVVILDTGSTDDTIDRIEAICLAAAMPVIIYSGEFKDFSQARNDAFALAKRVRKDLPHCQFALLMDADMELVVEDPTVFYNLDANAASYDMLQTGGAVTYGNRRIINLSAKDDPYIGVTHEYLDLPAAGLISGARFVDHADGFNRKDKYQRDADLLNEDLKRDPSNGRSLYYLGNTYRDGNQPHLAIDAYERRVALGGWDEETHSAMMNLACAKKDAGDHPGFVTGMVEAFGFRPSRAEPLHDLAKYYREEKNQPRLALLFAKAGLNIKRPNDLLFVNDYVYSHGLRYEFSIAGYYNEATRARSFEVTDDLALDPTCPSDIRWSARSNLYWHTKPLKHYCPSFAGEKIDFEPPAGYTAMNPSVEVCNGHLKCNVRCVNYKIDEHGRYMIGPKECNDAPIDTINYLLTLSTNFDVEHAREIVWPRPPAAWGMVTGLEDVRLWRYCGKMHASATVRELSENGVCQIVSGELVFEPTDNTVQFQNWKVVSDPDRYEKNWMPAPSRPWHGPRWMYRLDTVIEPGHETIKLRNKLHVGDISGSSQLIQFKEGFLAVVHEASEGPDKKRTYWHRFAWFDKNCELHRLSLPFVFYDRQIEFCAGLALHPDNSNLILSFGVRDAEAHLATVNIEEVARMIWKYQ